MTIYDDLFRCSMESFIPKLRVATYKKSSIEEIMDRMYDMPEPTLAELVAESLKSDDAQP